VPVPAATPAPVVAPMVSSAVCPMIGATLSGISLVTEPWTFMRTIQVMASVDNHVSTFDVTPGTSNLLGKVVNEISLQRQYALNDVHGALISKIVHPGMPWDTTQDIYNCHDVKMGSLDYQFKANAVWGNRYTTHKVLDSIGTHIADLEEEELEGSNFLSSRQHMVYLKSLEGAPLASMRKPKGGFDNLGPWSEKLSVQIDVVSLNVEAPPPAMQPEFLVLIFANVLGSESKIGPYWTLILWGIFMFFLLASLFNICCCSKQGKDARAKIKAKSHEENEHLLGTRETQAEQKVKAQGRNFWNCCSRRVATAESSMQKAEKSAGDAAHGAAGAVHGHH